MKAQASGDLGIQTARNFGLVKITDTEHVELITYEDLIATMTQARALPWETITALVPGGRG